VSAQPLEGPGEVGLHWHADGAAGSHNAKQHAGAVCALGVAGKQHVEAQLCDVLEFPIRGGVVDGDVRAVDEVEECVLVPLVVPWSCPCFVESSSL